MLTIKLASKRKPVIKPPAQGKVLQLQPPDKKDNKTLVIDAFNQKDLIIKTEANKLTYTVGDLVRPVVTSEYNLYGVGIVKGIVRSYKDWPSHVDFPNPPEKPQIVLIECLERAMAFNCTGSFVRALTDEEKEQFTKDKGIH